MGPGDPRLIRFLLVVFLPLFKSSFTTNGWELSSSAFSTLPADTSAGFPYFSLTFPWNAWTSLCLLSVAWLAQIPWEEKLGCKISFYHLSLSQEKLLCSQASSFLCKLAESHFAFGLFCNPIPVAFPVRPLNFSTCFGPIFLRKIKR